MNLMVATESQRKREGKKKRDSYRLRIWREMEKAEIQLKNISTLENTPVHNCTSTNPTNRMNSKCYKTKRHSCLSSIRFNGPTEIYRTVSNSSLIDWLIYLGNGKPLLIALPFLLFFILFFCFKWAWCRSNSLNPNYEKTNWAKKNTQLKEKTRMKIPSIFADLS